MPPSVNYPGVYVEETPGVVTPIQGDSTSVAAFVGVAPRGPLHQAVRLSGFVDYERAFGGLDARSEMGYAVRQFFANGGKDAYVVRVADTAPAAAATLAAFIGKRSQRQGIHALDSVDRFNLLCLPGVSDAAVLKRAAAYCEQRRAFLIIDAPSPAATPSDMVKLIQGGGLPLSDHAAVYYPWILVADPLSSGTPRPSAPCGTLAGVYARTDAGRGMWKAPAGLNAQLLGVKGLTHAMSARDRDPLNALGINCLLDEPKSGLVAWGARTLRGGQASAEYVYVPVRRLALFIEESIHRGTRWAVFEPNDERLWAKLRSSVDAFMLGLFRQGAFQGQTSREAYLVQCGPETTSLADIERGVITLLVGFAPLKPAEFLIIRIQLKTAQ